MTSTSFARRYGPWAFVAGASEGLGAAFADALAARGLHVALAARRAQKLEALAATLRRERGVEAEGFPLDLAAPDLVDALEGLAARREVGLVVANAAYAPRGEFLDQPLEAHWKAVDVNVRATLALAHVFGRPMRARGRGGLVIMSSMSGFRGTALLSSYAATKAFGRVFAEGLWEELGRAGVDVVASCAGATRTPGYLAITPHASGVPEMSPEAVAEASLAALGRRPTLLPGWANRLSGALMERVLPRRLAVTLLSRTTRKLYG